MGQSSSAATNPRSADVQVLLSLHLAFAREHSPPEDVHTLDINGLVAENLSFSRARRNRAPSIFF